MNSLLLHVCCAPCSTAPVRLLKEQGIPFATFFYNPNIESSEEYELRLATFRSFAKTVGIPVMGSSYEPTLWEEAVKPASGVFPLIAGDPDFNENYKKRQERCRKCYRLRFERLAAEALSQGFDGISTTLSISPYQFTDTIAEELAKAARRHKLNDAFVDYRPLYPESIQRSRELSLYRQNYCGCSYSLVEATLERQARKSSKARRQDRDVDATYG